MMFVICGHLLFSSSREHHSGHCVPAAEPSPPAFDSFYYADVLPSELEVCVPLRTKRPSLSAPLHCACMAAWLLIKHSSLHRRSCHQGQRLVLT